jgi:type I restriction enzyme S subunit
VPNGKAIAKCFLINESNKFTLNQRIGVFRPKQMNNTFLYYLLNRNKYFLSFDDGVNQTNLRKDDILDCPIIFPSISEQNRIVAVLETWDKTIEKLEKKIEIKKKIKKGLMLQLLSGTVRLTGFNDKWRLVKLEEISKINPSNEILPKSFVYIDLESVEKGVLKHERKILLAGAPSRAQRLLQKEDVLFQMVRPYQKNNLFFNREGAYVASTGYAQIRANDSSQYLYYVLHTDDFVNKVLDLCTGSNYPAINSRDLSKIKFSIPNYEEQKAIATILSSSDNEITILTEKLKLLKAQKNYLLNNLITGALRTPENLNVN